MLSFFGGGFDALCMPLMSQGDEGSVEESKEADLSLVNIENVTEMADHCGDAGCGGKTQAVTQSQCCVSSMTWDWDAEVLDHVLAHVLDKDGISADTTNDFATFVTQQGIDDVRLIPNNFHCSKHCMGTCQLLHDEQATFLIEQGFWQTEAVATWQKHFPCGTCAQVLQHSNDPLIGSCDIDKMTKFVAVLSNMFNIEDCPHADWCPKA